MRRFYENKWKVGVATAALLLGSALAVNLHAGPRHAGDPGEQGRRIKHVMLISIDGMHALDSF